MKKKNKAMRLASVLLVLTLFTTSLTAGTFAKYTTGANGDVTARVAKFGVDVTVDTTKLFGNKYTANDSVVSTNENGISVKALDDQMVVAPGTTGSMDFTVTGTTETDVNVGITVKNKENGQVMLAEGVYKNGEDDVIVATGGYYPVEWTLKKGDTAVPEVTGKTLEAINTYLQSHVAKRYSAGSNLETIKYTLSWKWAYDEGAGANDDKDTILGDLGTQNHDIIKNGGEPTENTDYCLTEAFTFDIKVTQAD